MILLLDIGNTHTHLGLAGTGAIRRQVNLPTGDWFSASGRAKLEAFVKTSRVTGAALCSVVPRATPRVRTVVRRDFGVELFELTSRTLPDLGIDYPAPETIGPDRLANALAARKLFGAPSVVVDFGTAVTFDIVDRRGNYAGGIITPGIAAMTDYLHEKTALLPRIQIREVRAVIGKSTEQAMLIGTVHGYRGLIRELIKEIKRELRARRVPVIATGGYARLIASHLPEITSVAPHLTLHGLRLAWLATRNLPLATDEGNVETPHP
ncbi:MAG: type III pantothenate kinase [Verrucomicrobia bacterium]|nr:type III pantothenate kinase [Verrucomicrobiota bacterium]